MRWSGFAAAAALASASLQPPQQPPQPPTFRVESNLVRVDVTVVDRRGEPMTTLTADDFLVEEDGVAQTVESFKFVSADGRPLAGDEVSLAIRSPEHAAAEAARDEVRVFLIFWDEYHIGQLASAIHGRKALNEFVTSAFGPSDLVALMDPLLPISALRFTRDRAQLAAQIEKLEGRFGRYTPTRSAVEDAQLMRHDIARVRSEVTLSAVKSAAVHLGSLKEGRKAIVFVSEGLTGLGRDQPMLVRELTDEANNNNTAIYTLDPRGLMDGVADVLRELADSTGGAAFVNTNTPAKALRQVVKDSSAFYLLGYASAKNPADGKFHKIAVRVKRPGVDVRARKGYWAPSQTERDRAATDAAAAASVPPDVSNALAVLSPRAGRTWDVWVGAAPGADRRTAMTVAWSPRPQPGRGRNDAGTVTVTIKGPGVDRSVDAPVNAGRLVFSAPAGELHLHTVVRDARGETTDDDERTIAVPDFLAAPLALSSPVVLRVRNQLELRALAGSPDVAPFAGREFVRTDRVFVRFAVYGAGAAESVVSTQLLSKAGAVLQKLPFAARAGDLGYEIDLPLSATARGEFLIAIEVSHGDERVRALVPFRVVS